MQRQRNPEMHDTAFDATYSWDFYHLMNDIAKGKKTANQIDSVFAKEQKTYPPECLPHALYIQP